ncbi:N4-gp56 family major capsid protein [Parasphingopyxis sp.]|uniref:N4-gp56 family major capsid protein n=1 Tax=Parasphingopyxis sp. TaxID=1920299 RepID=UPI0026377947|nr:N4-gp56 family major capsid protein [Parasphingopyxis sp.]
MAQTAAAAGLTPQQWDAQFNTEYLGNNPFKPYMGTGTNSIIQVKRNLTKKKGDSITYALVNKFTGSANDGTSKLEGNEEAGVSRSHKLTVGLRRNAFSTTEFEEQKSAIPLRKAFKDEMMNWAIEEDIDRVIEQLYSINGVVYGSASEANKDAWLVDNADRVLFGAAKANNSSNDHSASLANVDATNDKLTPDALSLMKRIALSANPKIKPVRVGGNNKRYYVVFAHPLCFRDLKANSTIQQAQREVTLANQNNKLFQGGDLEWDGMIIHEVDDMTTLSGVGAASIDVGGVFLCGAQAMGLGIAKPWNTVEKTETDYDNEYGCGVRCIDGLDKMTFGSGSADTDDLKDHGVVTGYFAAVADA